jgi:hypothetical protein
MNRCVYLAVDRPVCQQAGLPALSTARQAGLGCAMAGRLPERFVI